MKAASATSLSGEIAHRIPVVGAMVLFSLLVAVSSAEEPAQGPPAIQPLSYQGKTAAQWISQLRTSRDETARAQAAEALGFLAREGRATYGGFSDVPIDSPDLPKLDDQAMQPIVAALVDGLNDPSGQVRAASAIAVSWIGPRAKAAVPALSRLLTGTHEEAKKNALEAIGRIGPDAKGAVANVMPMLTKGDAQARVNIAGILRKIDAPPDSYLPTLIEALAEKGRGSAAHYAAMELGQLGDPAVAALKEALRSKNAITRQNAAYAIGNMAGCDKLTKDKEAVAALLIDLTDDADPSVVWYAVQAIGSVRASPDRSIATLVRLLKHQDKRVVDQAVEALGAFEGKAATAVPSLIELLAVDKDQEHRSLDYVIRRIGIDRSAAESLAKMKSGGQTAWLLAPMLEFPDLAIEFLTNNPDAVSLDRHALLRVMRDPDPKLKKLQDVLYANEKLPVQLIAELSEPRFLKFIERKLKTVDAHEATTWQACARACGAKAERVVSIGESKPGDFKPKSAWPGTDAARMAPDASGHGDGMTGVIITGRILREDGTPAVAPKFYRVNDSILLGERGCDEVPITFNVRTGRFVFVTGVFAAYSMGKGQKEAGPYQTGSAMVSIKSEGCKPLVVQFYDEMPDVLITLSSRK